MKTIKIPEQVHDELKVFCAKNKGNMSTISGFAIMAHLRSHHHQFIHPVKKISDKIKKQKP